MDHKNSQSASYAAAGVDITAGYKAVELMKSHIARTKNEGCLDDVGGFGGLFGLSLAGMEEPVLVSGTDGCGTKVKLAQLMDKHDTIGIDAVAMCVNDIICCGAKRVHMRSACPPIMFNCKYLNFSRSNSEMDLIARRTIVELEGEEGLAYLDEYCDGNTERGQNLRKTMAEKLHLGSLDFQSLEGVIEAIGIDPCKLCTYCWNGKE